LHDFDRENKDIWIKYTEEMVDFEVIAQLNYENLPVYMETKMNPGSDPFEEVIVKLKSGDKITANEFVHWH